ncbi:hypothetical protein HAX54_025809, partial [Datura stramonium]|nr:hypothetical protein [Datura stramonium]
KTGYASPSLWSEVRHSGSARQSGDCGIRIWRTLRVGKVIAQGRVTGENERNGVMKSQVLEYKGHLHIAQRAAKMAREAVLKPPLQQPRPVGHLAKGCG